MLRLISLVARRIQKLSSARLTDSTRPLPYTVICVLALLVAGSSGCNRSDRTDRAPITIEIQQEQAAAGNAENKSTDTGFFESYESTDRGIWQKPGLILETLGDLSDKVVADIGAGTGYLTLQIVPKARKVIAIDIDPRFISYLDSVRVQDLDSIYHARLEPRLARPEDPNLQPQEADVVTIVNTYMYIADRIDYLKNLQQGMTEDGRLLIIDFKKKKTTIGPPSEIRIPLYQVEQELKKAGFSYVQTNDTALDYQYIVMAAK